VFRNPQRGRGVPSAYLEVMPRDSSTTLRFARNYITAVLLAGGESRRMGTDKATIRFREKALWQVQLELLQKLEPSEIFISARSDPAWRPQDTPFVADIPPSRGPLSGLAASLAQMHTTHLLALAIDMPFMTEKFLRCLCAKIEAGRGVIPKIGNRAEALAAIYPPGAKIDFPNALTRAAFSFQSLTRPLAVTRKLRAITVTDHDKRFFLNVNEPADVKSA